MAVWWPGGGGKGRIVYDLVFYKVACCSEGETVLADSVQKPAEKLPGTDLSGVHTQHGFALGDPIARIQKVNGTALLQVVPHHPDLRMLSYVAMYDGKIAPKACGQWQSFIFRNNRSISIDFTNGC